METENIMAGLVPGRRSREELNLANDLLLKEHREYLASWKEAVTARQSSDGQVDERESGMSSPYVSKDT